MAILFYLWLEDGGAPVNGSIAPISIRKSIWASGDRELKVK